MKEKKKERKEHTLSVKVVPLRPQEVEILSNMVELLLDTVDALDESCLRMLLTWRLSRRTRGLKTTVL